MAERLPPLPLTRSSTYQPSELSIKNRTTRPSKAQKIIALIAIIVVLLASTVVAIVLARIPATAASPRPIQSSSPSSAPSNPVVGPAGTNSLLQLKFKVLTVAGSSPGFANSDNSSDTRFNVPSSLSCLSDGTVFVSDRANSVIRVLQANSSSTFAQIDAALSTTDGNKTLYTYEISGQLSYINTDDGSIIDGGFVAAGVTVDSIALDSTATYRTTSIGGDGTFTVTPRLDIEFSNRTNVTIAVKPATQIAVGSQYYYTVDRSSITRYSKVGAIATKYPTSLDPVAATADDDYLYILDRGATSLIVFSHASNYTIRKEIGKTKGFRDGDSDQALFDGPQGIAKCKKGLYVADTGNARIRLVALN